MTTTDPSHRPSSPWLRWRKRFADAIAGFQTACRNQESLWVHLFVAIVVVVVATILKLEAWRWCILILCIALVISLELMNSAIERLVKTLHPEHDAGIAESLHMAAAAVLAGAVGSIFAGALVILPKFLAWLS